MIEAKESSRLYGSATGNKLVSLAEIGELRLGRAREYLYVY